MKHNNMLKERRKTSTVQHMTVYLQCYLEKIMQIVIKMYKRQVNRHTVVYSEQKNST